MISPEPVISSSAILDFTVPGSGTVSLTLFNSTGQHIRDLYSVYQNPGHYQFTVTNQFSALAGGTYFIRIQQNGKSGHIKFIKK
jgi:hypothetical protein